MRSRGAAFSRPFPLLRDILRRLRSISARLHSFAALLLRPQITHITQMIRAGRDSETYSVIGAAMEVHRVLGPGFLEAVYQEALALEFASRRISFQSQPELAIDYKGTLLGARYRADFVCATGVVVELKAMTRLSGADEAQMLNYLKASRLSRGLLLNFGSRSLEYKRFAYSHQTESA